MPIVNWSSELSVGIETLDADHRRLLATMNHVFDSLLDGSGSSATHKALQDLGTYVFDHFSREEAWIAEHGLPEFETHRKEHQALKDQIMRLQQLQEQYDDQLSVELLIVLRDWLLGHIAHSDHGVIRAGQPALEFPIEYQHRRVS